LIAVLEIVDQVAPAAERGRPASAVVKGGCMLESRGFLFMFYAIEFAFLALVLVGLWRSVRDTRGIWGDFLACIRDDLFRVPHSTRGRVSVFARVPGRVGPPDPRRRYRAFYGVLRTIGLHRSTAGDQIEPCVVCGGGTVAGERLVCRHRGGPIHPECVPAIVRSRGPVAVVRWLHSGTFERGNL
jgi:hypothetical protein